MNPKTELQKLVDALNAEPPNSRIWFMEDSEKDNLYGLVVGTEDYSLRRRLGCLFGSELEEIEFWESFDFQIGDEWHGRGAINMRDLADQFIRIKGEFFNFTASCEELRRLAHEQTAAG